MKSLRYISLLVFFKDFIPLDNYESDSISARINDYFIKYKQDTLNT